MPDVGKQSGKMENMGMKSLFGGIYNGKRVLVTGHTGFKGSWLSFWLSKMGANLSGYSLVPPTSPNHFDLIRPDMNSIVGDIRDFENLMTVFSRLKPDIVFHLAAQPIVRHSYINPQDTFSTNVVGTINVFEASRLTGSVKAVINITSDKCYENREWVWGYRETDPLGGYDPYSASKGCAEIITNCWRSSFFNLKDYGIKHKLLLASCRAGNVIGGGDWAVDRLIPDIARSVENEKKVLIRNPSAIRPWQHVLDPLSGYLMLGQRLLKGDINFAEAWNFGPFDGESTSVGRIVEIAKELWPKICYETGVATNHLHEAGSLRLDSSKSLAILKWLPVWDTKTAVKKTTQWYRAFYENRKARSNEDLDDYVLEAVNRKISWV